MHLPAVDTYIDIYMYIPYLVYQTICFVEYKVQQWLQQIVWYTIFGMPDNLRATVTATACAPSKYCKGFLWNETFLHYQ